jgi:hypothetical protein
MNEAEVQYHDSGKSPSGNNQNRTKKRADREQKAKRGDCESEQNAEMGAMKLVTARWKRSRRVKDVEQTVGNVDQPDRYSEGENGGRPDGDMKGSGEEPLPRDGYAGRIETQ